jgi:hypothetical protein
VTLRLRSVLAAGANACKQQRFGIRLGLQLRAGVLAAWRGARQVRGLVCGAVLALQWSLRRF